KPSAISEYIKPIITPFDMSRKKKASASDMGGLSLHVLDVDARANDGLPAVLVGDARGQLHLAGAAVEGLDHRRVLLGHEPPAHLPGPRHLGVVGLEVLGEEENAADAGGLRQRRVGLGDLL